MIIKQTCSHGGRLYGLSEDGKLYEFNEAVNEWAIRCEGLPASQSQVTEKLNSFTGGEVQIVKDEYTETKLAKVVLTLAALFVVGVIAFKYLWK